MEDSTTGAGVSEEDNQAEADQERNDASQEQERERESEGAGGSGQKEQLGGAPAIAPKKLNSTVPPRPTAPHPGSLPSDQHLEAAEDAFTESGSSRLRG